MYKCMDDRSKHIGKFITLIWDSPFFLAHCSSFPRLPSNRYSHPSYFRFTFLLFSFPFISLCFPLIVILIILYFPFTFPFFSSYFTSLSLFVSSSFRLTVTLPHYSFFSSSPTVTLPPCFSSRLPLPPSYISNINTSFKRQSFSNINEGSFRFKVI